MASSKGARQQFFDMWSRFYDAPAVQRAIYRPVHQAVVAALRSVGPRSIADVGCGTGILTTRIAETLPGALLLGCDFSIGMLEQARVRPTEGTRPTWVQADGARLPLATGSVDAVISTESFHWFPDPDAAMVEFRRVLVAGGILIVALVNVRSRAASRMFDVGSRLVGEPLHWPTRQELQDRIQRAGFSIDRQQRVLRPSGLLLPAIVTTAIADGR